MPGLPRSLATTVPVEAILLCKLRERTQIRRSRTIVVYGELFVRIVFITNNYTPYSGGVVSSINASVDALHKAGHAVFIITLNFWAPRIMILNMFFVSRVY